MKINKITRSMLALALAVGSASCSDNNEPTDPGTQAASMRDMAYEAVAKQYLDNTVIITYKNLADNATELVENLKAVKAAKTDANVRKACETFLAARSWWEKSEAFLFGPANDFGIDPHIDSWPLDRAGLIDEMKNSAHIEAMAAEDGDIWAGAHLGPELLGFHGIEYIIFADGQPKAAADIPDNELIYAIAVAGDLRNKTWQLELSWAGEKNVADERLKKIADELEWPYTISNDSYKVNMLNAGVAGSTYRTWADVMEAIVDGCMDITDEVGTMKIGKPHTGEDVNYVESPYSHKSINDFHDNMVSVENAYMGGVEGKRNTDASLHAYIASVNADLDKRCVEAINNAKTKINAMKAPFVLYYADPSAADAMDACRDLTDVLTEVKAQLTK